MKTKIIKQVYAARDRQGEKFFTEKPSFHAGSDIFRGSRWLLPLPKKCRVLRRFTARVIIGSEMLRKYYPKSIAVRPYQNL